MDFSDHVWTECYTPFLRRWMHLDPCEGIYDNPLLYEKGWNKSLNYIIGIAKDGVYDVTKRYTRKWHEVLSRRTITTESNLSTTLMNLTKECRRNFASTLIFSLEECDRKETEELDRNLHCKDSSSVSLPGRQSGDKEWRILRSEFGSDSISSSSCPVRKCMDEHVSRIYNALCPVITLLVDQWSSKSKAIQALQFFRKILIDLKSTPFRKRRISVDSSLKDVGFSFHDLLPLFIPLLDALFLKSERGKNGTVDIFLAAEPVRTSITLPILFHALDDVFYNINRCEIPSKSPLTWPLLKLNRICSGLVLASGEELPFGIATSAFDGMRLSKWEEPNGARGCWIIYKTLNGRLCELVSYELMSANDAPERDPMDWYGNFLMVVEGSDDGGSSWRVMDKQTSQIFESRYQRKPFKIKAQGFLSNAFRLRFLAVRDEQATSRFQIGSIDLFAKSS